MSVTVFPAAAAASKIENTVYITATGTWTVPTGVNSINVLALAGGGGGGGAAVTNGVGGGGGGGGIVQVDRSCTAGTVLTVTIGAGGAAGTGTSAGQVGGNTTLTGSGFTTITALGGGASRGTSTPSGSTNGGCGAGSSNTGSPMYGGGGGGQIPIVIPYAGSTLTWGLGSQGLQGQPGIGANANLTQVMKGGTSLFGLYGGGGGGGTNNGSGGISSDVNYGGYNAGTGAFFAINATSGVANFGGGGGGGNATNTAGAGGSGLVIIKYWA